MIAAGVLAYSHLLILGMVAGVLALLSSPSHPQQQAQTGLAGPLLPVPRIFKLLLDALGFKIKPYIGNLLVDRSCRRQVSVCPLHAAGGGGRS